MKQQLHIGNMLKFKDKSKYFDKKTAEENLLQDQNISIN